MNACLHSDLHFAPPGAAVEKRGDGTLILRSPQSLAPFARAVGDWLVHWARSAPDRVFLAERAGDAWRKVTYAEALEAVRHIGEALLVRGLSATRPVAILSDNSVDHALLALGAMHAGIPVAPISPTLYFNVPCGFDLLLPFLEADAALRKNFFRRLDVVFYAGAALPQNLWERLEALAAAEKGGKLSMLSAWGSTETSPMATCVHYHIERAGVVGVPGPGTELKLIAACDPIVQDAVITGHDREDMGALVFVNPAAAKARGLDASGVRAWLQAALSKLHQESTGSSTTPVRLLVADEPPSIDANEITDKGYINQRAVLERRAALVEHLHSGGPGVIFA